MRRLRSLLALPLLATLVTLAACDSGPGTSLYDPDAPDGTAPVISSVSPNGIVLAGIDEITITGQNFSETAAENLVFFDDGIGNAAQGAVISATTTQLVARVPNLPNPALRLRVSVQGAEAFSNAVAVPLTPAFVSFGGLDPGFKEDPRAISTDREGGVYVALYSDGASAGVIHLSPDGTRSVFSTASSAWRGVAPISASSIVAVRQDRGVFQLDEGTSTSPALVRSIPNGNFLRDVVAVGDGTFWTAGTNATVGSRALYQFTANGTVTATVPFSDPVVALAVGDGALYVATSIVDADRVIDSKVWRFPLESGGLGTGSVFYDVVANQGAGVGANAIAVAADGTVFVATNAANPLLEVGTDGTGRVLYPGVLPSPLTDLVWSTGTRLYAIQGLTQAEIDDPTGQGLADLFQIEVRRQGPY